MYTTINQKIRAFLFRVEQIVQLSEIENKKLRIFKITGIAVDGAERKQTDVSKAYRKEHG